MFRLHLCRFFCFFLIVFFSFFCALFTVVILNRVVTITGCDHRLEITVLKSAFNRDPIKCNYHRGMATSNATGYKYRCLLNPSPKFRGNYEIENCFAERSIYNKKVSDPNIREMSTTKHVDLMDPYFYSP